MVERRSPKPDTGVRSPHPLPAKNNRKARLFFYYQSCYPEYNNIHLISPVLYEIFKEEESTCCKKDQSA